MYVVSAQKASKIKKIAVFLREFCCMEKGLSAGVRRVLWLFQIKASRVYRCKVEGECESCNDGWSCTSWPGCIGKKACHCASDVKAVGVVCSGDLDARLRVGRRY